MVGARQMSSGVVPGSRRALLPTFYGQVGNRCYIATATGDNLQYQFESQHDVWITNAGSNIIYTAETNSVCGGGAGFADSGTGGALTASMGVEYPVGSGNWVRSTWAGATSASIASNTFAWSQTALTLPAGKSRIKMVRRLKNANVLALTRQANGARRNLAFGDAAQQSLVDRTMTGGVVDDGGDYMCWPAAIVAQTNYVSVGGIGDSITAGEGDSAASGGHQGILFHALGDLYPYINQGVAGQGYVTSANSSLRRALLAYCTTIVSANGINARVSSAATMYAASLAQGSDMSPREYWQATLLPKSDSNATPPAGWTDPTGADQTVDGFNSNRAGFNDLLRAGLRCLENADQYEITRNGGKWKGNTPHWTDDGTHPNSTGYGVAVYSSFAPTSAGLIAFMPSSAPV